MPWLQIHAFTDPAHAGIVEDLMLAADAIAVSMDDAADQPIYEPDLNTTPLWQQTRVTGLFDASRDVKQLRLALAEGFHKRTQQPITRMDVETLADRDWEREWMDDFKPICFGSRLWICPSWHTPPDAQAVNLMLDPGLAFGTGTHPTTALCLQWLDQHLKAGQQVIDYGCGSGILALAALLLGATQAQGVDTDPQALEASRENARRNGIDDARLSLFLPQEAPLIQTELLLANILAQPLIELAPTLVARMKPAGDLVLSGILQEQADGVIQRYLEWFDLIDVAEHQGWVRIHCRMKSQFAVPGRQV